MNDDEQQVRGRVVEIHRFPVKSMQGEQLEAAELDERGVAGDRAYAVVDTADGSVASAKRPRRWGRLLEARATFVEPPTIDGPVPPALIALSDGTEIRTDDASVHSTLSSYLGREVELSSEPVPGQQFHEVWPDDVDPIAPDEFIADTDVGAPDEGGASRMSAIGVAGLAPPGRFVDLTPLHVLTTTTLAAISALEPDAVVDVRRYRPNLLVDVPDATGFLENDWPGRTLASGGVAIKGIIPTMRCVMTTLAQGDLEEERSLLRALARANRIEIRGLGTWACAGLYASVDAGGRLAVGDEILVR